MSNMRQKIRFARWHLGHTIPMIVRHSSTYPELPRKSAFRRFAENLYIYLRHGYPCAAYDGLGLDIKGRRLDDFVGNLQWIDFLCKKLVVTGLEADTPMQRLGRLGTSPTLLLQDKYCFWSFMERHGIPVVPVLAHTIGGKLFETSKSSMPTSCDRLFAKPVAANCGNRAFVLSVRDGKFYVDGKGTTLDEIIADGEDYIFQPFTENHADIKAINPTTLNTVRIVTCRTPAGTIELWDSGMMRIGRAKANVDNFAKGGIGVGIDESGRLKRFGYSHDSQLNYAKTDRHPDSQIVFEGREVPFYRESVELATKAHALFPSLQTIGWDVAITADGPTLVEGNHDWDMEMLQVVHHKGAASRFREIYGK